MRTLTIFFCLCLLAAIQSGCCPPRSITHAPIITVETPKSSVANTSSAVTGKITSSHKQKVRVIQFPDANLQRVVRQSIPPKDSPTNQIYDIDVKEITSLNANFGSIADSTGIEALTGLRVLALDSNSLTNLNVSRCTQLEELSCRNNRLTNLDISGCSKLQTLRCVYNWQA